MNNRIKDFLELCVELFPDLNDIDAVEIIETNNQDNYENKINNYLRSDRKICIASQSTITYIDFVIRLVYDFDSNIYYFMNGYFQSEKLYDLSKFIDLGANNIQFNDDGIIALTDKTGENDNEFYGTICNMKNRISNSVLHNIIITEDINNHWEENIIFFTKEDIMKIDERYRLAVRYRGGERMNVYFLDLE